MREALDSGTGIGDQPQPKNAMPPHSETASANDAHRGVARTGTTNEVRPGESRTEEIWTAEPRADEARPESIFDENTWEEREFAVQSHGYRLVAKVVADARAIARLEASRLVTIAELYRSEYMCPLPVSPAAHSAAEKTGRKVRDLEREDTTRAELTACLFLGDRDARRLVETALALTTRFPATLAALSEGRLDLNRAAIMAEVGWPMTEHQYELATLAGLSPDEAERVAAEIAGDLGRHILKKAPSQGPTNLRDCLNRAVHRLDPAYADRRTKNNLASRQITCRTHRGDGTAELTAHLGVSEAKGIYNVLDSYARTARHAGSKRNLNELRVDAMTHLILHGHLPDGSTPLQLAPINTESATVVPPVDPQTGDIQRDPDDPNCPSLIQFFKAPTEHANPATEADSGTAAESGTTRMTGTAAEEATSASASQSDAGAAAAEPGLTGTAADARSADHPTTAAGSASEGRDHARDEAAVGSREGRSGCFGGLYSRSGLRTHVQIVVKLETLLGLDDEPAELDGHGPITAATARDLAFTLGSTWRRLVTDPIDGYLLDVGRKTYRPPAALADHVRAQDVTCRTPNCTRPASKCDLDHVISWPAGSTSEQNLECKCDIDHRLKHEGRWTHQLSTDPNDPRGTIVMISPTGHVYLSHPHDYTDPWPEKPTRRVNSPEPWEAEKIRQRPREAHAWQGHDESPASTAEDDHPRIRDEDTARWQNSSHPNLPDVDLGEPPF